MHNNIGNLFTKPKMIISPIHNETIYRFGIVAGFLVYTHKYLCNFSSTDTLRRQTMRSLMCCKQYFYGAKSKVFFFGSSTAHSTLRSINGVHSFCWTCPKQHVSMFMSSMSTSTSSKWWALNLKFNQQVNGPVSVQRWKIVVNLLCTL